MSDSRIRQSGLAPILTPDDAACMQALSDMLDYEATHGCIETPANRAEYEQAWDWYAGWMEPLP